MPEINLETNVGRNLEALVDANGLRAVVEALAAIAYAKADHIQEAWQDRGLARLWLAAGRRLATTAESSALWRLEEQGTYLARLGEHMQAASSEK